MNAILETYGGKPPFYVYEREVDLALLQLLHVSGAFAEWFSGKAGHPGARLLTARHSVSNAMGESDILAIFEVEGRKVAIMVEDKIGAGMQPQQAERYRLRGDRLVEEGEAEAYATVLCAPEAYLAGVPDDGGWDARISLEDIAQEAERAEAPAWKWTAAVMLGASARLARARKADDKTDTTYSSELTRLKLAYYEFVKRNNPALGATTRQDKPYGEYHLKAVGMPKGMGFRHNFSKGEIRMWFSPQWVEAAKRLAGSVAPEGHFLWMGTKELLVCLPADIVDPAVPFEGQEPVFVAALEKIESLLPLARAVAASGSSGTMGKTGQTGGADLGRVGTMAPFW